MTFGWRYMRSGHGDWPVLAMGPSERQLRSLQTGQILGGRETIRMENILRTPSAQFEFVGFKAPTEDASFPRMRQRQGHLGAHCSATSGESGTFEHDVKKLGRACVSVFMNSVDPTLTQANS